jgi:hypothetical protein
MHAPTVLTLHGLDVDLFFFGASHPRAHMMLANTLPSHSSTSFSQPELWIVHLVLPNFVGVSLAADEVDLYSLPINLRVRHLPKVS